VCNNGYVPIVYQGKINMNVQRLLKIAVVMIALAMVAYHLLSANTIIQQYIPHINTHLGFSLVLVFLAWTTSAKGYRRLWPLALMVLSLMCYIYIQVFWKELLDRSFFNTTTDLAIGIFLIVLAWEATRKTFGLLLPMIVLAVVIYPFIGSNLPQPFYCHTFGLKETIAQFTVGLTGSGMVGTLTSTSMHYVFLFVVFGSILQATGATTFFISLAKAIAGKLQGGPALLAVASSALVGTINGSTFANVAITGSFTIPLMKKTGYMPHQAGAVEAAASNGGQVLPPIMGIGAFIMAAMTDVPYIHICAMAVFPAILYYVCVGAYVYLRAGQLNIGRMLQEDEKIDTKELLLEAPKFVIPFAIVIAVLVADYSVMYAGFWVIVSAVAVSLMRKKTRPSLGKLINGFTDGAIAGAGIGASIACVSMLGASFTMSGLGVRLSHGIELWSGGYLLAGLLIVWGITILLGCGGIGFVTYIIISIFAAPALIRMGVPFIQAHFFIFFSATFIGVTPPMAPAAIIGSKLAGAKYMQTAIETFKIAAAGILLPFVFIYAPVILLQPVNLLPELITLTGFIIALMALQIGSIGYYFRKCSLLERVCAIASTLLLIAFVPAQIYTLFAVGTGLFVAITIVQLIKWRKNA
jgi:TRAP transporter 4TM/12TM fusion protein